MPRVVQHSWSCSKKGPLPVVTCLDNGRVVLVADASTDADGAPDARIIDKEYGRLQTSLSKDRWKGEGTYVNARTVPYFVLPKNWNDVVQVDCKLGDIAKISYRDNLVYAIYADVGGKDSIGEASILAVEALGWNPWDDGKITSGIPFKEGDGVTYEIIPGSRNLEITKTYEDIQFYGRTLFEPEQNRQTLPELGKINRLEIEKTDADRAVIVAFEHDKPRFAYRASKGAASPELLKMFPNATFEIAPNSLSHLKGAFSGFDMVVDLQQSDTAAGKFISYFKLNYPQVRNEVASWFVRRKLPDGSWIGHEPTATSNACVAHQVTCLKQCSLPYPDWNEDNTVYAAINVDVFVGWALEHGWTKVSVRTQLVPGDICVSGPNNNLQSLDHVYAFLAFCSSQGDQVVETDSGFALVLHNQHFGVGIRSLNGVGAKEIGGWRFALRMPEI